MNMEQTSEKRIRREIANSNERRRMQSINAGFSSLRNLLPHHEVCIRAGNPSDFWEDSNFYGESAKAKRIYLRVSDS